MNKLLVFGGSGLVGSRFIDLNKGNFEIIAPSSKDSDITNLDSLRETVALVKPETVINFAAFTDVQGAEQEKDNQQGPAYKINSLGPKNLAQVCAESFAHLIQISTDYVFDGEKPDSPYTERDIPNPINWYGKTKFLGEDLVKKSGSNYTIIRIEMPYRSSFGKKLDIARIFLQRLRNNKEILAVEDSDITPTFVDDIANALKLIADKRPEGIYNVVSTNSTTPFKFATLIAQSFDLDTSLIKAVSLNEYDSDKPAKLLRHSWLTPEKFINEFGSGVLHSVEESIELFKNLS